MAKRWYVVHAYSGFENKVADALKQRVERLGMQEKFGEILVPTEEVVEMRGGQKRKSQRKFFPGYVLVEMELDEDSWHLVKETPRVMGFIGGKADKPSPITEAEARATDILGLDIKGHVVRTLWIEKASDIAKEYYLWVYKLRRS